MITPPEVLASEGADKNSARQQAEFGKTKKRTAFAAFSNHFSVVFDLFETKPLTKVIVTTKSSLG